MEARRFKDLGCEQCKVELRKQITQEIHEAVGCLACDRLYHHESKNPNIKSLT